MLGQKCSEATKEKIRLAHLGTKHTPETKLKMSLKRKGVPKSEQMKARLSATRRGAPWVKAQALAAWTPERKRRRGLKAKQFWLDCSPEQKAEWETRLKRMYLNSRQGWEKWWTSLSQDEQDANLSRLHDAASTIQSPTSIERTVHTVLAAVGINYQTQVRMGRYTADIVIPSRRLVIECDGTYWHARLGAKERDEKKDAALHKLGYRVLRLKEQEIKRGMFEPLLKAVV